MEKHIGFNEERDFERGKPLTDDQKRHLRECFPCGNRIEHAAKRTGRANPKISWLRLLISKVRSIFRKKKAP